MASLTKVNTKQEKYGVTWQLDAEIFDCNECRKPFNAFRRRHHCRNCGMIFCDSCTKNKMSVRGSTNLKRVCDPCKLILVPMEKNSTSTEKQWQSDTTSKPKNSNSNSPSKTNGKKGTTSEQEHVEEVVLRWADELQDGSGVTCHFQGALVIGGTACWYRSNGDEESRIQIERQKLASTRDCLYIVHSSDVGYFLTCVIETGGQQVIETTSDTKVTEALPGLQSVNIGLRPHQHTLRCDRSERVCDAVGKFREGETLYMTMITRSMEDMNPSEVQCSYRWLKSTTMLSMVPKSPANASSTKKQLSRADRKTLATQKSTTESKTTKMLATSVSFRKRNGSQTYTQASVIFDFEAIEANEMSVKKGCTITDVEVVDVDWARGSCNGLRGAVPTNYIQLDPKYKIDVNNEDSKGETKLSDAVEVVENVEDIVDIDSDDENHAVKTRVATRKWRGSIFKMCEWEEIGSGTTTCDQTGELKVGLDHVGYMIALEVTLKNLPPNSNLVQLSKKSLPVGPIEAANCRIDNLIIVAPTGVNVGKTVRAEYDYYGGYEGASKFSWIRITPEGSRDVIHDFEPRQPGQDGPESYVLTQQDMGCRLKVHVRVLRDDGLTVRNFLKCWFLFFCLRSDILYVYFSFLFFFNY